MLLWDIQWKPLESKVAKLDAPRLLMLGVSSIDQVIAIQGRDSMMLVPSTVMGELERALANVRKGVGGNCAELEEESQGVSDPGVYDLIMAVVTLSRSLEAGINSEQVLETLSYCYQSVLDKELISNLERNMTERELNELERGNVNCLKCIDGQIGALVHLTKSAAGQKDPRSN